MIKENSSAVSPVQKWFKCVFGGASILAILLLCAMLYGCKNENSQGGKTVLKKDGDSLTQINEGSNFKVYILKREGNEYIVISGIHGTSIVKHR